MNKKYKISDYWNMGTAIGFCTAIGIVLGAMLNNVAFWLCVGAGVGVILGGITHVDKK